jgi:hypothetical protein
MTGSNRVDHWTSGTMYECSEIAGSSHYSDIKETKLTIDFEASATYQKVLLLFSK